MASATRYEDGRESDGVPVTVAAAEWKDRASPERETYGGKEREIGKWEGFRLPIWEWRGGVFALKRRQTGQDPLHSGRGLFWLLWWWWWRCGCGDDWSAVFRKCLRMTCRPTRRR
ncbi:hypothetical protein CIRG_03902 [Coccidioides immitis RMSCC 2394]|uniref:Uncharacterized protein n=1 Tax=Coccidioides immitis RMSCC 2394 TaxID=404692 RepID=A0A0J6Y6C0_COCIT|nr:hypothetical protein CIRG_03902 [Coccidioides immitis RMSCC 2394]